MGKCSKCGRLTKGGFSMCFSCNEKLKDKKLVQFGRRRCAGCGAFISGDKKYCYSCYKKH